MSSVIEIGGTPVYPADEEQKKKTKTENDKEEYLEFETFSDEDPDDIPEGIPIPTKYESKDIPIPDDFLTTPPPAAHPITVHPIDFSKTVLPERDGLYAVILDNVLTPAECQTLLQLAEASVPDADRGPSGARFWRPAMVNAGNGYESLHRDYRNSDRIVWDQQEVADRLWARCAAAPGIWERLGVIEDDEAVLGAPRRAWRDGKWGERLGQKWEFRRLNMRMRFLKYGKGQFFRPHCDASYREPGDKAVKTLFTLHLYLNDSVAEAGEGAELVGGATSFLSSDESRKMDVNPKAGRVLIFQHRLLYHSGDDVLAGTKYTMRSDMLYEMIPPEGKE